MLHEEQRILERLCAEAATPFALKARQLLVAGDWVGLASLSCDPNLYSSASEYLTDRQIACFLKKSEALPVSREAEQRALDDFFKAEALCYWTNERLIHLSYDKNYYGDGVAQFLTEWRKEISLVLGSVPAECSLEGRFGPGSTFLNRRDLITVAHKLHDSYSTTKQALDRIRPDWEVSAWGRHAAGLVCPYPRDEEVADQEFDTETYRAKEFTELRGNRFTTVPKDALRKRGIAVEPSLNVFYQLAIGSIITQRLNRTYGWSKKHTQRLHRLLAKRGSLLNSNATIDLSMASDTVSYGLVSLLLPPAWFDLLTTFRSPFTYVDGRWVKLEKFSSMGNGFTFELETLIFFSLCKVLYRLNEDKPLLDIRGGSWISVFGDDIIVPKALANDVLAALSFFGFKPNVEKTFVDGPFRESCGGDYFNGADVRPHYQKNPLTEPQHIISCVNGLIRYQKRCEALSIDRRHSYIGWLIHRLPRPIQNCRGPSSLGDLVICEDNESRWNFVVRNSIRYFSVYRPIANRTMSLNRFGHRTALAVLLYQAGDGSVFSITSSTLKAPLPFASIIPRISGEYVSGYKLGRVASS